MLSLKQIEHVCNFFDSPSKSCRYLLEENKEYFCLKKTGFRASIDNDVENYINKCKDENRNPENGMVALGDHCAGLPYLKNKIQGLPDD
jgi:hypothetical protein